MGVNEWGEGAPLGVVICSRKACPVCGGCGGGVWSKGCRSVVLVDLPAFGRPVRVGVAEAVLDVSEPRVCAQVVRWTRLHVWSGAGVVEVPGGAVGDRPGGSAGPSGRRGRRRVGLWVAYGEQGGWLLGRCTVGSGWGSDRRGPSCGSGRESLFWRQGQWRTKQWCTSVVDVGGHQLIDIVPGRTAESAAAWFRSQPADWLGGIRWAVSGHVRFVSEGV